MTNNSRLEFEKWLMNLFCYSELTESELDHFDAMLDKYLGTEKEDL